MGLHLSFPASRGEKKIWERKELKGGRKRRGHSICGASITLFLVEWVPRRDKRKTGGRKKKGVDCRTKHMTDRHPPASPTGKGKKERNVMKLTGSRGAAPWGRELKRRGKGGRREVKEKEDRSSTQWNMPTTSLPTDESSRKRGEKGAEKKGKRWN